MSGLTIDNPIKFLTLITSSRVVPGDTIYMRGGTYSGDWITSIAGTLANPVVVQPYNNEPVTIRGSLQIGGAYTHWNDITVINETANDVNSAVYITQAGTELDGFDISSSGANMGISWFGSGVGNLLNSTIHDTGSYGIYTHNHGGGAREITNCVFAASIAGYYSIHLFRDGGNIVQDYTLSGCTFYKPVICHAVEVSNMAFTNNNFHTWLKVGNGRTIEDIREAVITGNTFDGEGTGIIVIDASTLQITGNTFAVTQIPNLRCNISLQTNTNEVSTTINTNNYTGGNFVLQEVAKTWQQWQAAGYDAAGSYT
jgi:hypothetical protein